MPRAGLDAERVVTEAVAVAEEVGIANLSLAAIAARLGVKVPSLYKHIGGLDDLQQRVAVRARGDLAEALEASGGGLGSLAAGYRDWARAHPGLYPATLRAPLEGDADDLATSTRAIAVIYSALAQLGVEGDAAIDATRALRATLHGFVSLEAAGGFGLPRDIDRSFARTVELLEGSLRG
jgi:AcrR family transcriptional regulator